MDRSLPSSMPNLMPGLDSMNSLWDHAKWFLFLLLIIPVALAVYWVVHKRVKKIQDQRTSLNQRYWLLSFDSDLEKNSGYSNPFTHETWFPPYKDSMSSSVDGLLYSDYYKLTPAPHYKPLERTPPPIPCKQAGAGFDIIPPKIPYKDSGEVIGRIPPPIPEKLERQLPEVKDKM